VTFSFSIIVFIFNSGDHVYCAFTALTLRWNKKSSVKAPCTHSISAVETPHNLRTSAMDNHRVHSAFLTRFHGAPVALQEMLLSCYGVLTAIQLRSYYKAKWHVCLEHAQNVRRRLAFYAMPLRCCGDVCDFTALTSAFWMFFDAVRTTL
jgi:hypothetical protein